MRKLEKANINVKKLTASNIVLGAKSHD